MHKIKKIYSKSIEDPAKKIIKWLDSKWWFLPKTAIGFKVLISFAKNKNFKEDFIEIVTKRFGFYVDKENKNSVIMKKGRKEIVGTIRMANLFLMKGIARNIIKLMPFLQRYGMEAQFRQDRNGNYVRFIITPFMELFDSEEKFLFSQGLSESIADEAYCRSYANKIVKELESAGGKKIKFESTGSTWREVWSSKERKINKRKRYN